MRLVGLWMSCLSSMSLSLSSSSSAVSGSGQRAWPFEALGEGLKLRYRGIGSKRKDSDESRNGEVDAARRIRTVRMLISQGKVIQALNYTNRFQLHSHIHPAEYLEAAASTHKTDLMNVVEYMRLHCELWAAWELGEGGIGSGRGGRGLVEWIEGSLWGSLMREWFGTIVEMERL
jgi:hypothetical protein